MSIVAERPLIKESLSTSDFSRESQLDALTSLRFFAAAMIVFLHSSYCFFDNSYTKDWQLAQGVAFFFILSGFILAYIYPKLEGKQNIKDFLWARLARIWPSHLVISCITLCLLPCTCTSAAQLWTNLFMLNAWIPRQEYYFSVNAVAWTLSVEMFFYLTFTWLIKPWKFGWVGKALLALGLVLIFCSLSDFFAASDKKHYLELDKHFFLYINPLARLAEFIVGILTAGFWLRFGHLIRLNKWQATILEVAIFAMIIIEIGLISKSLDVVLPVLKQYPGLSYWLTRNGPTLLFAGLILITVTNKGYIARTLSKPIFTWLGKISYSIYLVHFLLIQCFNVYLSEFIQLNCWLAYATYWAMVIIMSHFNYSLIENPCRKLVKRLTSSINKERFSFSNLIDLFSENYRSTVTAGLISTILVIATGVHLQASQARFQFVDLDGAKNVSFGNDFVLEKVSMATAKDGSKVNLIWRSLRQQTLHRTLIVQLVDKNKKWLAQHNQADLFFRTVHPGQRWTDTIYLPSTKNQRKNWENLALSVRTHQNSHASTLLGISGGPSDWWNTRFIVPINKEAIL